MLSFFFIASLQIGFVVRSLEIVAPLGRSNLTSDRKRRNWESASGHRYHIARRLNENVFVRMLIAGLIVGKNR